MFEKTYLVIIPTRYSTFDLSGEAANILVGNSNAEMRVRESWNILEASCYLRVTYSPGKFLGGASTSARKSSRTIVCYFQWPNVCFGCHGSKAHLSESSQNKLQRGYFYCSFKLLNCFLRSILPCFMYHKDNCMST